MSEGFFAEGGQGVLWLYDFRLVVSTILSASELVGTLSASVKNFQSGRPLKCK